MIWQSQAEMNIKHKAHCDCFENSSFVVITLFDQNRSFICLRRESETNEINFPCRWQIFENEQHTSSLYLADANF